MRREKANMNMNPGRVMYQSEQSGLVGFLSELNELIFDGIDHFVKPSLLRDSDRRKEVQR